VKLRALTSRRGRPERRPVADPARPPVPTRRPQDRWTPRM